MNALPIAPVFHVTIGAHRREAHLLHRFTQSQDQQDLEVLSYAHVSDEAFHVDVPDHTSAKPLLDGSEQDRLSGDAVVAAIGLGDAVVSQDDDVGGRPFPMDRAGPVRKVSRPTQVREDESVPFGIEGYNIFQGLQIGSGGREPGKVNQVHEQLFSDVIALIESPVAAAHFYEFPEHFSPPYDSDGNPVYLSILFGLWIVFSAHRPPL